MIKPRNKLLPFQDNNLHHRSQDHNCLQSALGEISLVARKDAHMWHKGARMWYRSVFVWCGWPFSTSNFKSASIA